VSAWLRSATATAAAGGGRPVHRTAEISAREYRRTRGYPPGIGL
jgi:hypothetical protein